MFPVYELKNNGVSISTAITVLQLQAGTAGPIRLLRASLTQPSNTGAQVRAALVRKTAAATVTAAVAGTTLVKLNPIYPTANATLATNGTGITGTAEGTDGDIMAEEGAHTFNGWLWVPAERGEQIVVPQSGIIALKFMAAPQAATWLARIVFEELRGG